MWGFFLCWFWLLFFGFFCIVLECLLFFDSKVLLFVNGVWFVKFVFFNVLLDLFFISCCLVIFKLKFVLLVMFLEIWGIFWFGIGCIFWVERVGEWEVFLELCVIIVGSINWKFMGFVILVRCWCLFWVNKSSVEFVGNIVELIILIDLFVKGKVLIVFFFKIFMVCFVIFFFCFCLVRCFCLVLFFICCCNLSVFISLCFFLNNKVWCWILNFCCWFRLFLII